VRFSGDRWEKLARRGARVQRPLWASTSTKDPTSPDTLYVDGLIGPDTVTTMPESTIAAFEDHGRPRRTVDTDLDHAQGVMRRLAAAGIDMDQVGAALEAEGIASFHESFQGVLRALDAKARRLASH
jgi:transaldolase